MKRLRRVTSNGHNLLWYSGDKTFKLVEVPSGSVLRTFERIIEGLPNEAIGFFDVWQQNYLIVSTYAKEKRLLYMHNIMDDTPMMKNEEMSSVFKSNMQVTRDVLGRLSIF